MSQGDTIVKNRWSRTEVFAKSEIEDEEGNLVKDPGRTQQHHAASVDIRNILMAAKKGIPIESVAWGEPRYGDFSNVESYVEARQRIAETNEQFEKLPALVRSRFKNDPQLLIKFLQNPDNLEEAIEMGIVPKPIKADQAEPKAPLDPPKEPASPVQGGE